LLSWYATLDTDAIGSCRLPAACCGVVGFKVTHGLISVKGVEWRPVAWGSMRDVPVMIWVAMAAIVATALIVAFVTGRNRSGTIVIGQQIADARANETARLASGSAGPSPMPKGEYDPEAGEYGLVAVTECPLDKELQGLVRAFKAWTPEKRSEVQGRISMDEQYTLIHFAKRCSILALKEKSIARSKDGLLALAMIDETRIDQRDGAWAVGLLAHAIEATGADRERLVNEAAALATPGMAKILRRARERSRLSEWGYTQIQAENGGVGLVRSGLASYEPTLDMSGLALRLAANLQRGRYTAEPQLAVDVPIAWFEKAHRADAEQLLRRAHAAISVQGTLRKAYTDNPFAQQFVQWVADMPSAEEANTLVEYVDVNTRLGSRFVIGVASGRLFSLLVAGSSMEGVDSFETPQSLASIANETRALLQETVR
jgi:hypothetical protein